jgi:hypothetical protein
MSNAMSRSKSRWKGALLAAAATAVISPLAAKAQSMQVGLYANPLSGTSPNVYSGKNNVYIDPYDTDTLYVYATVTGTAAPSASYVDGLEYLYYNVNAAATGTAGVTGSITAAVPGSLFGGGNFSQTTGNPGAGAQGGLISSITTTPSIVLGSNSSMGSIAKPRSAGDVYVSAAANSGSNIIVNGDSVSFLVETLTYTPNSAAVLAHPTVPGALNSVAFNVSIPSLAGYGTDYTAANYFVGLPSVPSGSPGGTNTSSGYTASPSNVTLTNALPGDVNLDGIVNIADYNVLNGNFGSTAKTGWTNGDLDDNGIVNIADYNILNGNFGANLGVSPSGLAGATALIAPGGASSSVPEPTAGLLLIGGGVASVLRRRKGK